MLISVNEAQKIYPDATVETCKGLELMVRKVTNNNFQRVTFRGTGLTLVGGEVRFTEGRTDIFRAGDRVEINSTDFNDGLYTVSEVADGILRLDRGFIQEVANEGILTKIEYPEDVLTGVKKLLAYDAKMSDKIGVKSEAISRWSVTYYDVTASESQEGYPAVLLGFLKKYRKLRW